MESLEHGRERSSAELLLVLIDGRGDLAVGLPHERAVLSRGLTAPLYCIPTSVAVGVAPAAGV